MPDWHGLHNLAVPSTQHTVWLTQAFWQYAEKLYPEVVEALAAAPVESKTDETKAGKKADHEDDEDDDEEGGDIEAAVKSELKAAKAPQKQLFKTVRIDIACGMQTPRPNEARFRHIVCANAKQSSSSKSKLPWTL